MGWKRAVIGVDVGTGGVRAVAVDEQGTALAASVCPLAPSSTPFPGWIEQDPEDWWRGVRRCLRELAERTSGAAEIAAVSVDSTSGTVLAVDAQGCARRPAVMYNDGRAGAEAEELNGLGAELSARLGYRFNSSYGLAKALWLLRHEPDRCRNARFLSPADFLAGRLCGDYGSTDDTNALKMGYDLLADHWPEWLASIGLGPDRLPSVHRTGEVIGRVTAAAAGETGLPAGAAVAIGPTDGVAAIYASGACRPGEAATTLGATLVIKAVSRLLLLDPLGRVYCHRHAEGHWLPGGASNCGCRYGDTAFPGADLDALSLRAERRLPCAVLLYPLPVEGERFPVVAPDARDFIHPAPADDAEHFAAYLQGTAFVERWAYETVAELGGERPRVVFTSGGGSRSGVWMQTRADILGCPTALTAAPDAAFGSAVVAASRAWFGGVSEAASAMIREARRFEPRADRRRRYDDLYAAFRAECASRGLR